MGHSGALTRVDRPISIDSSHFWIDSIDWMIDLRLDRSTGSGKPTRTGCPISQGEAEEPKPPPAVASSSRPNRGEAGRAGPERRGKGDGAAARSSLRLAHTRPSEAGFGHFEGGSTHHAKRFRGPGTPKGGSPVLPHAKRAWLVAPWLADRWGVREAVGPGRLAAQPTRTQQTRSIHPHIAADRTFMPPSPVAGGLSHVGRIAFIRTALAH